MAKCRCWCFTVNNPDISYRKLIKNLENNKKVRYCAFQVEEKNTIHYQGYIELNESLRMNETKKLISNKAHLEQRHGTRDEARDYVLKSDTRILGPWEIGKWLAHGQGNRSDLDNIVDIIKNGGNIMTVASEFPREYIKFNRGIEKLLFLRGIGETEFRHLSVFVLWGDPNMNKTRTCFELYPDLYKLEKNEGGNLWWDGYVGQDTILIDDFYGWIDYEIMLHILDGYPLRLAIKGAHTWAKYTCVLITSNSPVEKWYYNKNLGALKRRITEVYHLQKCPEVGGNTTESACGAFRPPTAL